MRKLKWRLNFNKLVKEVLNLDDFIEYSLNLRANIFKMCDLVSLGDKRRLQNLVFPEGIIYNKETWHIEPLEVNQFFVVKGCKSDKSDGKENGQTDGFINLSAFAPHLGLEPKTP